MRIFKREEGKSFDLDSAISSVFGFSEISKVCNYHTFGTIEVNGKAFDWIMSFNSIKFIEA